MEFLCLEFIGSQWYRTYKSYQEFFENAEWLDEFCSKWNLPKLTPFQEGMEKLLRFREFLFRVTSALCTNRAIADSDINRLNDCLKSSVHYRIIKAEEEKYQLDIIPQMADVDWVIFKIACSFCELITEHPLEHLKLCANPDCGWVFYDDSKSHTKKWCGNKCASLIKVRKHRAIKGSDNDN